MSGISVKQSIVRDSELPTDYKPTQFKPEIVGDNREIGLKGEDGLNIRIESTSRISAEGVHQEINAGTTIRPSIIKNSVLPTIDGGTRVLKTVFRDASISNEVRPEGTFGVDGQALTSTQYQMEGGTSSFEGNFGEKGILNNKRQYNMGSTRVSYENEKIIGVDEKVGDNAADVTYSTKPDGAFGSMISSKVIQPF